MSKDTSEKELPIIESDTEMEDTSEKSISEESTQSPEGSFEKKEIIEDDDVEESKQEKKAHKKAAKKAKHAAKKSHHAASKKVEEKEDAKEEIEGVIVEKKDEDEEKSTEQGREQVIANQLAEIYENSDGSMPDMKTFESRKTSAFVRALVIFLISCLFFGAAAWVGLFILQPRSHFSETDVSLTISGEDEVSPGTEVTYRVRYRNAQSVTLTDVVLEVRYPEGFKVTTTTKAGKTEATDMWELENLDPGSGGYIDITGTFFGDSGSEQSIRSFLSYKPSNFTSTFQTVATKKIKAKTDSATLEIGAPEQTPRGAKTPLTITITPNSGTTLEHVRIICTSNGFTPNGGSTPAADPDSPCQWSFEKITDKTVIEFSGMFTGEDATSDFAVEFRGWDSEEYAGEGYKLTQASKSIKLVESSTNISLVINGGAGDTTISPGETIAASIVVQNKGDAPLTDVSIEAVIDGPSYSNRSILGWQDLEVTGDAAVGGEQLSPDTRRGKITWNKQYVPELASIAPGKEVKVDVSIPIRSGDQITLGNFTTNNIVFATSFSHGTSNDRKTIASNQINLSLVSDFTLKVNHDLTGTGGVLGTYDISWTLSNSFHPLKNIKLEADLYGDVEVDQSKITAGGGSATYEIKDKRIIWTIPEMPTSVDVLNLEFSVVLKTDNPTQKDLMSKVRMSAEDDTTHVAIKKVGDGISLR